MNFISIDNESCGKSLECETIDESLMCAISAEGYVTEVSKYTKRNTFESTTVGKN